MKSTINMFSAATESKPLKTSNAFSTIIFAIVILLIVGANAFGYFFFSNEINTNNRIKNESETFISNETNKKFIAQYDDLSAAKDALVQYSTDTNELALYIENEPSFTTEFYNKIVGLKPKSIEITDMSLSADVLTISCFCSSNDNGPPSNFAQELDQSGLFYGVAYTGFNYGGENQFTFTVNCNLKEAVETNEKF